ncbi:MAG: MFS transporter, partial [Nocardioides sp.]
RYVALAVPLARGWERQTDVGDNPLFYNDGALTPASYHRWLHQLAVRWVAVPADKLDFGSVDEADLIASGLPYLHLEWQSKTWKLYRVQDSTPLARRATVTSVGGGRITLVVSHAGRVPLQVRWSNHLSVLDGTRPLVPGVPAQGCLARRGQWTTLRASQPGTYVLGADFDAIPGVARPGGVCPTPH